MCSARKSPAMTPTGRRGSPHVTTAYAIYTLQPVASPLAWPTGVSNTLECERHDTSEKAVGDHPRGQGMPPAVAMSRTSTGRQDWQWPSLHRGLGPQVMFGLQEIPGQHAEVGGGAWPAVHAGPTRHACSATHWALGCFGRGPGGSLREREKQKSVPIHSVPKKTACSSYVQPGWWRLAVGGWWGLAVGGGWRGLVVGDWSLVAVGSGWRLVVGRRWRSAAVGGWRLVAVGGWRSLGAVLKGGT